MRRNMLVALTLVIAVVGTAAAETPVYFADATLKAIVEASLGKTDPTPTDLLALTGVTAEEEGITSLVGLEHAPNLTWLSFHVGSITDVTPLKGLTKLECVELGHNKISDLSPLAGTTIKFWLKVDSNPLNEEAFCTYLSQILANNTGIELEYSINGNPPQGVTASDGAYPDKVRVTWTPNCTGPFEQSHPFYYRVARSDTADGPKSPMGDWMVATSYDDTTAMPGVRYWYWVTQSESYDYLQGDQGYAGIPGTRTLTVSTSAGGTASLPGIGAFQYNQDTRVAVAATASTNYHFVSWTGTAVTAGKVADARSASTTVTMDADYTLQVNFVMDRRTLTTSASSGGAVSTPGVGSFQYDHGATVSISATAVSGSHFVDWTGSAVTAGKVANANSASTTVTMDGDYSVQANFVFDKRTLTTSASSGGTVGTPGIGSFQYNQGTTVSISAAAAANYHFVSWSGSAVTAGKVGNANAASTTVTVDSDYTLQANFASDKRTLVTSTTSGGTVTTPGLGSFQYQHGAVVAVAGLASSNNHFVNWTGSAVAAGKVTDPNAANTTVTMDADYALQANFAVDQPTTLTTSVTPGGTITAPGVGSFQVGHGMMVLLKTKAELNHHFVNWTGTAVSAGKVANPTAAKTTVVMDADYTLQANFAFDQRTLNISSTGGGAVSTPGSGTFQYDHGAMATVAATPLASYRFVNWTGTAVTAGKVANPNAATTTATLDGDYTLQANFAIAPSKTLTLSSSIGGTLSTPGVGIFQYAQGTTVSVVATASTGNHFVNWTGTAVAVGKVDNPNAADTTVTLDGDYALKANFAADQQTKTLTISAGSGGTVSSPGLGSFQYNQGTAVSVVATASGDNLFLNWTGTAVTAGKVADPNAASTTVTLDGDYAIQANFEAVDEYTLVIASTAGGSVVTPAGGVGSYKHAAGEVVSIAAEARPLFRFVGWGGGFYSNDSQASITMTANCEVKAYFESVLDTLYVDDDAPSDPGPGDPNISDPAEDGTATHPLDSIQKAMEVAKKGAKIVIRPGIYPETINLDKSVEVSGLNDD